MGEGRGEGAVSLILIANSNNMKTNFLRVVTLFALALAISLSAANPPKAQTNTISTNLPGWMTQPLSLPEALNLALQQNGAILKGQADLEATHGVVVQTRAIALPRLRGASGYSFDTSVERFPFSAPGIPPSAINPGDHKWNGNIRLEQTIYEGGRIRSALRSAQLMREQAILQYQAVIADALLEVRVAYYDVLLSAQQTLVQEASVTLLQKELENTKRRFEAGTVPRFNVLRAEVEVAHARPKLIRAINAHRIAKNNLASLLGYHVPATVWEDIPFNLAGSLEAVPSDVNLPTALAQALDKRPELGVLRKTESLRREGIVTAKSTGKPNVSLFAGYGARNSSFGDDFFRDVAGWNTGVQLTWDLFDGFLTQGKVREARARSEKARVDLDDQARRIELEVRTFYLNFMEAKEVLESQKKVQEQAEEALRLAVVRSDAGTGTQLDVLNAQTALTEARTTQIQALRDYAVARARLERATGASVPQVGPGR